MEYAEERRIIKMYEIKRGIRKRFYMAIDIHPSVTD